MNKKLLLIFIFFISNNLYANDLLKTLPIYGATGIDLTSTWMRPCYRELNPIVGQNRFQQAAVTIGAAALVNLVTKWFDKQNKTKTAWIIRSIHIGAHTGASIHNFRLKKC